MHQSFLMFAPEVLTIALDRNFFSETLCTGLLEPVPIEVPLKVNIKNVLIGATDSKKEEYSLVEVINFDGKINIDGHSTCVIFVDDDVVHYSDSQRSTVSKAKFIHLDLPNEHQGYYFTLRMN